MRNIKNGYWLIQDYFNNKTIVQEFLEKIIANVFEIIENCEEFCNIIDNLIITDENLITLELGDSFFIKENQMSFTDLDSETFKEQEKENVNGNLMSEMYTVLTERGTVLMEYVSIKQWNGIEWDQGHHSGDSKTGNIFFCRNNWQKLEKQEFAKKSLKQKMIENFF